MNVKSSYPPKTGVFENFTFFLEEDKKGFLFLPQSINYISNE